jgi:two-component system cell cycle response regulator CpdR
MNTVQLSAAEQAQRIRILLVEDNEAAGRGLARLLEASGFEVAVRRDGVSALRTLESDPPPDFILTDLRLPDLDGREIAQRARDLVPPPRVALITGWDLDCDLVNYQSWGIDWVFPKPLDTKSLINRLREPRP